MRLQGLKQPVIQCLSYLQGTRRPLRHWSTLQVAASGSPRKENPTAAGADRGDKARRNKRKMKLTIAVEGCCHGELDKIYATLQHLEQRENKKVDLLICCGDFQAVRNLDDLETLACPPKYRAMHSFYKYYSGERIAPIPTVFIGGNHEAANHLWELYYGGWVAPNIYFLGFAGAVRFGGLRIAGLSGIYKAHDYRRGHHETLPYTESTVRSLYHVRDFEVFRLLQLQSAVDIFVSHDWPADIARYGNMQQLLARKPFLRSEVESGTLGSPPGATLLAALRPAYWFSAHMHVKFVAVVQHSNGEMTSSASPGVQQQQQRPQQSNGEGVAAVGAGGGGQGSCSSSSTGGPGGGFPSTRFLALDKCLPGRDFLQVIEVDAAGPPGLHYDEEWLAVLRSTHALTNLAYSHAPLPGMGMLRSGPRPEDVQFVRQALAARGGSAIPNNFSVTAPPYDPVRDAGRRKGRMPQRHERNPQTVALLDLIGVPYNLDHGSPPLPSPSLAGKVVSEAAAAVAGGSGGGAVGGVNRPSGRAPLSLTPQGPVTARPRPAPAPAPLPPNPEEIDLGDLDEEEEEQQEAQQQQQQQQGEGQQQGQQAQGQSPPQEGSPDAKAADLAADPMFQPLEL